jgi:membrane protein implicated in regulation of membrane protease activity
MSEWVVIAVGAGVLVVGALVTSLWTVQILLVPVVIFGVLLVMLFCPSEKRRR